MSRRGPDSGGERPVLVGSRVLYRGRVVTLRVDTLDLGGGNEGHVEVVEHADGVTILAFNGEGRVLLVEQHRQPVGRRLLELPAGSIDEGESPAQCAERELREETGMRPGRLERLGGFYVAPGYDTEYLHVFLATDLTDGPLTPDPDERIDLQAVTLEELGALIDAGVIEDAKTIAALTLYQRKHLH